MWKVTISRKGSGAGQSACGKTLNAAYASAIAQAGERSLSGLDAGGARFGRDIRDELNSLFKSACSMIKGHVDTKRVSCHSAACVDIERI